MKNLSALFVLVAFVFTLQLSVQPLMATDTGQGIEAQSPSVVEHEGGESSSSGKKSILPIVLGVVAVGVVAAVLVLVVFKTKYDIIGEWQYSWKFDGENTWRYTGQRVVCSGDKKSGTLTYLSSFSGTYAVDGKSVTIVFNYSSDPKNGVNHTGKFETKDKITGTWVARWDSSTKGSFEMIRKVSAGTGAAEESKPTGKR